MPHDNDGSSASAFLPFVVVAIMVPIIAMTVLVAALWGIAQAVIVLGLTVIAGIVSGRIIDGLSLRPGEVLIVLTTLSVISVVAVLLILT